MEQRPHIGIIGEGSVGSALAQGLRKAGYTVATSGHDAKRAEEVAAASETIILAVPHAERRNAVKEIAKEAKGKTIVDVSNAVGPGLEYGGSVKKSGAEEIQGWMKEAKVVKAFNTVFAEHMADGQIDGQPLTLLVAGDDPKAKQEVEELADAIGFESMDAGPLENARWLEALGFLNMRLAYQDPKLGPEFGLRLVSNSRE